MDSIEYGFVPDAVKLVKDFASEMQFDFTIFAAIWKKYNFSCIFRGRPNFKELLEFTNAILRATLELFDQCIEDIYEHVGYLYLLYALFRHQPIKPAIKARITLDYWTKLNALSDMAAREHELHILFVLRYMIRNGFDFVYAPTLLGPLLSSSAAEVDLTTEPPELDETPVDQACKLQIALDKCFQELKIMKNHIEDEIIRLDPSEPPYSRLHNIPFKAFLDSLEPYPPPTSDKNKEKEDIGSRRALIKAAAYNKTILKAHRSVALGDRKGKGKGKGRARKQPEEQPVEQEKTAPDPEKSVGRRGQKREKLFKKKYMFQYEEAKKADPPSPKPGCSHDSD